MALVDEALASFSLLLAFAQYFEFIPHPSGKSRPSSKSSTDIRTDNIDLTVSKVILHLVLRVSRVHSGETVLLVALYIVQVQGLVKKVSLYSPRTRPSKEGQSVLSQYKA